MVTQLQDLLINNFRIQNLLLKLTKITQIGKKTISQTPIQQSLEVDFIKINENLYNCKLPMTTFKGGKKGVNRQQVVQQVRREHVDRELFTLDYLNQSMNYITYDNQSLTNFLDTDTYALDRLINEDVKKVGLHFVQKVKGMKQVCDQSIFGKDLQEYGDFVNYDFPKSYQKELFLIQSQLKQQFQIEIATKRLKRRFPSIGNRMTSRQINKLNGKLKEQVLTSLIHNFQMIPEQVQHNLQSNFLYRQLFNISEAMRDQNLERQAMQKFPSEQGIAAKIRAAYKSQKQSQNIDRLKSRKIAKLPKKNEVSLIENEEYIPKQSKKGGKPQQLPLIIEKPVLLNPQLHQPLQLIKPQKQLNIQTNSIIYGLGEFEQKPVKISNSLNQDFSKKPPAQSEGVLLKKEKISQQPNNISVSQQRVKRKYTKTPKQAKQGGQESDSKNNKPSRSEKESKPRKEREKKQKRQQDQGKKKRQRKVTGHQQKKLQAEGHSIEQHQQHQLKGSSEDRNHQQQKKALVSIAIQTGQNEVKNQKSQDIREYTLLNEPMAPNIVYEGKKNIFESIRIEQWKDEKNVRLDGSMVGRSSILGQSSSFQNPNSSRRDGLSGSRQDNILQQSSVSVSNPFLPQNPQNHERNQRIQQEQNEMQQELDISQFLN